MKYVVVGADRETGRDVEIILDATSETDATTQATGKGVLISHLRPAGVPAPARSEEARYPVAGSTPQVAGGLVEHAINNLGWGDLKIFLGWLLGVVLFVVWLFFSVYIIEFGSELAQIVWAATTATSAWVGFDSAMRKIPFDPKYPYQPITNGWARWLLGNLLLWVVMFPYYLVRRTRVVENGLQPNTGAAPAHTEIPSAGDVEAELRRFKRLLDDGLISQEDWLKKKQQLWEHDQRRTIGSVRGAEHDAGIAGSPVAGRRTDSQPETKRCVGCETGARTENGGRYFCAVCGRQHLSNLSRSGTATAGFVMGITSMLAWIIPIFGLPVTVIGIILSLMGRSSSKRGLAMAGLTLSIIGAVLTIINASMGAYQGAHGTNWTQRMLHSNSASAEMSTAADAVSVPATAIPPTEMSHVQPAPVVQSPPTPPSVAQIPAVTPPIEVPHEQPSVAVESTPSRSVAGVQVPDSVSQFVGDWQGKGMLVQVRTEGGEATMTEPQTGYHSTHCVMVNGSLMFRWSNLDEIMILRPISSTTAELECFESEAATSLEAGRSPDSARKWQKKLKLVASSQ